jgi:hypothetical protein
MISTRTKAALAAAKAPGAKLFGPKLARVAWRPSARRLIKMLQADGVCSRGVAALGCGSGVASLGCGISLRLTRHGRRTSHVAATETYQEITARRGGGINRPAWRPTTVVGC